MKLGVTSGGNFEWPGMAISYSGLAFGLFLVSFYHRKFLGHLGILASGYGSHLRV